jgi:hypothetical protein
MDASIGKIFSLVKERKKELRIFMDINENIQYQNILQDIE